MAARRGTTGTGRDASSLLRAKRGRVDLVDVPPRLVTRIEGVGAPGGEGFQSAIGALYSVAYTAKFAVRAAGQQAPKVMPLEAIWSFDREPESLAGPWPDPAGWRWTALIEQLPPVDHDILRRAIEVASAKKPNPSLSLIEIATFSEGRCAQTLHVGPYDREGETALLLEAAIREAGGTPAGGLHEI